jgi:hypothetical protein
VGNATTDNTDGTDHPLSEPSVLSVVNPLSGAGQNSLLKSAAQSATFDPAIVRLLFDISEAAVPLSARCGLRYRCAPVRFQQGLFKRQFAGTRKPVP